MEFAAYVTRTAEIGGLFVERPTFGKAHRFETKLGRIEIALPSSSSAYSFREGPVAEPEALRDNWFEPGHVEMRLELAEPVHFEGTEGQFNSPTVYGTPLLRTLDPVLHGAFDNWRRILRWAGLAPMIDLDEIEYQSSPYSGLGFKIIRAEDDKIFYGHGGTVSAAEGGKVTVEAWNIAGQLLADNATSPAWFDYLFEAVRKNSLGDYHAAVIASALACEALVRATLDAALPPIENPAAQYVISNAGIQALLQRWPDLSGQTKAEATANGKSEVHKLFDLRNELMHARLSDLGRLREIGATLPAITTFILAGDALLRERTGRPNVIFPAPRVRENMTRLKP